MVKRNSKSSFVVKFVRFFQLFRVFVWGTYQTQGKLFLSAS
ncbi:unnamed protein product [Prunus brigantina]